MYSQHSNKQYAQTAQPVNPPGFSQQQFYQGYPQNSHQPDVNMHQQHFMQYAAGPGQSGGMRPPINLMQPPALNAEQTINTNSQFLQQRAGAATMSNNEHSEFDMYQNQEQGWNNQIQVAAAFWEQKCYDMLGKFQWFYGRFEDVRNEYNGLSEQIQKLDTEQDWHLFQQHHDQFFEKIVQLDEELAALMGENEQLYQQKMTHDNENMWEQRYQELLGNFKSLQEELANRQTESSGGVPLEKYQNLEDQLNELHYQYNQVVNELQKQQNSNYQEEVEMQLNQYTNEIEKYKMNLTTIHNENVELQNMIVQLENENKMLNDNYHHSGADEAKFQELARLIQQKQMEIQALQQDYNGKSSGKDLSQYENKIRLKDMEQEQLKRIINDQQAELNNTNSRLQTLEEQISIRLEQNYQNERAAHLQKIRDLEKMVKQLQSSQILKNESSSKIEKLEKKLQISAKEAALLQQDIKKKNDELQELRQAGLEAEKLKDVESDLKKAGQQKARLQQTIKKKNAEIETMHVQIQSLSNKVQQLGNKRLEYSTRNLMLEIEDLNDQLRKNEAEVSKLKSVIELKEEYCLKIEDDLKKTNDKCILAEQTLVAERDDWKEKELKILSKNSQHEKRLKNLDYEFNLQLKDTLEKQISILRKQNAEKQDIIRKMQENQILLSSKLAIFEKQKTHFDKDISFFKKKEKELESLNENISKRFRQLQSAYLHKEQELESLKINHLTLNSQLTSIKGNHEQLTSTLRNKNKTIEDLQRQVNQSLGISQMVDKLRAQNSRLRISVNASQDELQKLKLMGESKLGNSKVVSSPAKGNSSDGQENIMIQQLQRQNQYLKEELGKMYEKLSAQNPVSQKQLDLQQKKSSTTTVNLNKRLNQFNSKLQFAIGQNEDTKGLQHSRSQKLTNFWEAERKELVQKYENQLRKLQDQLRQNSMGRASQISDNSLMSTSKKNAFIGLQSQKTKEEVDFYRGKTKELQIRNESLIKINEQLRGKIDGILKVKQTTATSDFYREQNSKLQADNQALKNKLKKTYEENRQYKIELSVKNSKLAQQYQYKMLELELVIQDLKRKISFLQTDKIPKESDQMSSPSPISNKPMSEVQVKRSFKKRESYDLSIPESPKYNGIQAEFQSVLGNLRNSPKGSKTHMASASYSSHNYVESRLHNYAR